MLKMVAIAMLVLLTLAGALAVRLPGDDQTLGIYTTSLKGRTHSQAFNARRAARALRGVRIGPGEVFSFNARVGPWNAASGYRKAPVSYDGELMRSYGGGVCQTSTTLYNAVLLAGLEVVERHRHIRPPLYVAPGRDAAVAMPGVDLRFRNPYPYPVRLEDTATGDRLVVAVRGRGPRRPTPQHTHVQPRAPPPGMHGTRTPHPGQPGFTARTFDGAGDARGLAVARDTYPPVSRLEP